MISSIDIEVSLKRYLDSINHPFIGEMKLDTAHWQRFDCPNSSPGNQNVSYKAHTDGCPCIKVQCHKCHPEALTFTLGQHVQWSSSQYQEMQQKAQKHKAQEQAQQLKMLRAMQTEWNNALPCLEHAYFSRKELTVAEEDGLRIDRIGRILCPVKLISGELISSQSIPIQGKKKFYLGTSTKDGFHVFGSLEDADEIYFGEGIATCLTVKISTGKPTVCIYGKRFSDIAPSIAKAYPGKKFIYCCDLPSNKEPYTSEQNARKAIQFVGGSIVLPDFSEIPADLQPEIKRSDFNDLYVLLLAKGLEKTAALDTVRQQIQKHLTQGNFMTEPNIAQSNQLRINEATFTQAANLPDLTLLRKSTAIPHNEILRQLLQKISAVDFRILARLSEDEKIRNSHFQIITVEKVLQLAKNNNWGICRNHEFIYLYNGTHWCLLEEDQLKTFLGEASEKLGVDEFKGKHFNFRDHLFKQFLAVANLPKPERSEEDVLINLQNGTFEISPAGVKLRAFDRTDFITYQLPFLYNPEARAPVFEKYLSEVLPDNQLQNILSEYLGYIFIRPRTLKLEKTLILYGKGANGKSVLYEIVRSLLGEHNTSEYSLQSLTDSSGYYRAMIANKLVNYASEINGRLEASIFKQLVSGEPVEARLPYGRPFTLDQYAKLIFNCNELPKDVEQTDAYFRRFLIIPFNTTIPEHQQDKQLAQKIIRAELSGVFNWVLAGLKRLLEQKQFTVSEATIRARETYELESDSVKLFLQEKGYRTSSIGTVMLKDLYSEYKFFCIDDGFKPVNKSNFRKRLESAKIVIECKNVGNIVHVEKKYCF